MQPKPLQPKTNDGYAFFAPKEKDEEQPKPEPKKDPWLTIDNDRLFKPAWFVRW